LSSENKKHKRIVFLDSNGKIFGKINFIDLFIILLIIIVTFGSLYRFNSTSTNINAGSKLIDYEVKISDVKASSAKFYEIGLDVYDSKTKIYLGKIKNIIVNDYYDYVTDLTGQIHKTIKPDKIEIILQIEGKGIETDRSYLLSGTYELKVGTDMYILTKYADVNGLVYKIKT
jgi:hypothetical protein